MHLLPLAVSPLPIVKMNHAFPHRSTPLSPPSTPELDNISKLVTQYIRGSAGVHQIERIPGHLRRIYKIRMTDRSILILKLAPSTNVRQLRREHDALAIEATALQLLAARSQVPIPQLIQHDPHDRTTISAHSLQTYRPGVNMSYLSTQLSSSQRDNIYRTLGTYFRQVSSLAAPKFGSPNAVFAGSGFDTWRECFSHMLESVLRDGEDVLVNLPYDVIRYHMHKQSLFLDEVTEARVVLLEITNEKNVLIDEQTKQVNGLVDLSEVVLGDPFMATAFIRPNLAFLEGYGSGPSQATSETVRQLLYHVYRGVVAVVKHYYRPQSDGRELQARRNLTEAIKRLSEF
ncbi:MAG: hypothetical protein M1820_002636 [Bogoriella megaspora]|nr:MAG: hypothetical protein M1820_002636 [Bogoriella megaspora]